MALGYSVRGQCFATAQEALDAFYTNTPPFMSPLTGTTSFYKFHYQLTGTTWQLRSETITVLGDKVINFTVTAPTNIYGSCTLPADAASNFADGMTLGWGVAAAMVFAWAIWVLRRGL